MTEGTTALVTQARQLTREFDRRMRSHGEHWNSPASIYSLIAVENIQAWVNKSGDTPNLTDRARELIQATTTCNENDKASLESVFVHCQRVTNSLLFSDDVPRVTAFSPHFFIRQGNGDSSFRVQVMGHFPEKMAAKLHMGRDLLPTHRTAAEIEFQVPQRNSSYNFDHPGLTFMLGTLYLTDTGGSTPPVEYPIKIGAFTPQCGLLRIIYEDTNGWPAPVDRSINWGESWVWDYPPNLVAYRPHKIWFRSSLDGSETMFTWDGYDLHSNRYLSRVNFHHCNMHFIAINLA